MPPTNFKAMKTRIILLVLALTTASVQAKLNVVATITDFGAIAREVGGDEVKVTSIAKGTEDSHFVDAKPSFVRVLNQADVLIEGGAELEIGWLPPLVNGARNSRILGDALGHIVLGPHIKLIEVPSGPVDRSMGDIHPLGNPHFWLDPENGKVIAAILADRFSKLDPANKAKFEGNQKKFTQRLNEKMAAWSAAMAPYRGARLISYHKSFDYFLERYGLVLAGTIESRPGIEPSPAYITGLIQRLQGSGVKLVMIEPYRPRKTPAYVAQQLGTPLLVIPEKVGGNSNAGDYISLFEYDIAQVIEALQRSK